MYKYKCHVQKYYSCLVENGFLKNDDCDDSGK